LGVHWIGAENRPADRHIISGDRLIFAITLVEHQNVTGLRPILGRIVGRSSGPEGR
jgi:hypothetical protein